MVVAFASFVWAVEVDGVGVEGDDEGWVSAVWGWEVGWWAIALGLLFFPGRGLFLSFSSGWKRFWLYDDFQFGVVVCLVVW